MNNIFKAFSILKNSGIIIFPTDTAYGIGCRMDDEKAVERLIKIRKRPDGKAFPVLVDDISTAERYLEPISKKVRKQLIDKYWPGGLTIVLNCIEVKVPALVRGGGHSLGVRAPNNPRLISIIEKLGVPILGPSANYAGGDTPFSINEIDDDLIKLVDFVLEGDNEINPKTLTSTVIDCTGQNWKVLREGVVKL